MLACVARGVNWFAEAFSIERREAGRGNAGGTAPLAHPVPVLQYGRCGFVRKLTRERR